MAGRFSLILLVICTFSLLAERKEVNVSAGSAWVDTGIEVKPGDVLTFSSTGTISYQNPNNGQVNSSTPDGLARGWMDLIAQLPVNSSGKGALVGRWGDNPAARAFLVGANSEHTAPIAAHLSGH